MSEQPMQDKIEELLRQLKSSDASDRERAAWALGQAGVRDKRVINSLKEVASQDALQSVVDAANAALQALGQTPAAVAGSKHKYKPPPTREQKILHFAIGFIGWFVINGLMWAAFGLGLRASQENQISFVGGLSVFGAWICVLPINVGALIVLGLTRRWIALGALAAFAVNIVITLIMGALTAGVCGIPFFLP